MFAGDMETQWGGSCDCGTFLLDCVGCFTDRQVSIAWTDQRRSTNDTIEDIIEKTWQAESQCAADDGRRLYNGRLCRLADFTAGERLLRLTLGEVSFKEFLGTNLTHAYLRYTYGPDVLANALGVSAVLRTDDGFLLLGRRSQRVVYHPGRIHPVGGVLEQRDPKGGPSSPTCPARGAVVQEDPFAAVVAELVQETNIGHQSIDSVLCLGLVRDKHIVQPELVFDVKGAVDFAEIRRSAAAAQDAEEHSELLAVRDHPAAVVQFIRDNYSDLTALALASLLLHGLRHWGSGWFAATRGSLRSVL